MLMEMPKPGPELKKLDFFVGNWMADVTMYSNEFMPGGKSQGKESMKWELDGMFVSMDYQDQPGEEKKMPAYKGMATPCSSKRFYDL